MQRPHGGPTKRKGRRMNEEVKEDRLTGRRGAQRRGAFADRLRRNRTRIATTSMAAPTTAAPKITAVLF